MVSDDQQVCDLLRSRFGLRVQPEMGRYIVNQLRSAQKDQTIPVMGGDARTGVAIHRLIPAHELLAALNNPPTPTSAASL